MWGKPRGPQTLFSYDADRIRVLRERRVRPCPARGAGGTRGDGTDGTFSREDDVTTDGRMTDGSRTSLLH